MYEKAVLNRNYDEILKKGWKTRKTNKVTFQKYKENLSEIMNKKDSSGISILQKNGIKASKTKTNPEWKTNTKNINITP